MPGLSNDPLWYRDAIFYELHVRAFKDANGDGIGDFRGLTEKVEYLASLGIDCIWLLPFYQSPLRDDGYDIADYYQVHPDYGTVEDFRKFLDTAHAHGIRVIADLVLNHTSDQHSWFRAARERRDSEYRDFYVWSDDEKRYEGTRIIFTDTERSNWTWDPIARQYYWHRFFAHQPDLNFENPRVRQAMFDVMTFWMDLGLDGYRCDAVPYLFEREGTNCENLPETHAFLKQLRGRFDEKYKEGKILLAEANQWPSDVCKYFGDGDEFHMAFHFPLMPRIFMALRQEDRHPITEIIRQTPEIPNACQWGLFLRNHDELTLEMVTNEERDYMYHEYAKDPRMKLNLGIRRRLAPLLDGGRRRIELLNAILFSMPGSPILYYGDEIGMGDNIYLGDRNGVRTPMQWSPDRNAGFSKALSARLYAPVISDPPFGYQSVNVEVQENEPTSLLAWMKRLIRLRKRHPVFGRGSIEFLRPENRKVLAYIRKYGDDCILCVNNLSRFVQPCELDLKEYAGRRPIELIGDTVFPEIPADRPYFLSLGPHGFIWFKLPC
jgi:maltose alpha-D-glucosyltransferase / alpha-amylase